MPRGKLRFRGLHRAQQELHETVPFSSVTEPKEKHMDKFSQLVEDLVSGELTLTHVQIAVRTSIRQRKDLPDGIKDLLAGSSVSNSGVLYRMFKSIQEVIGNMELAYRRGSQKDG